MAAVAVAVAVAAVAVALLAVVAMAAAVRGLRSGRALLLVVSAALLVVMVVMVVAVLALLLAATPRRLVTPRRLAMVAVFAVVFAVWWWWCLPSSSAASCAASHARAPSPPSISPGISSTFDGSTLTTSPPSTSTAYRPRCFSRSTMVPSRPLSSSRWRPVSRTRRRLSFASRGPTESSVHAPCSHVPRGVLPSSSPACAPFRSPPSSSGGRGVSMTVTATSFVVVCSRCRWSAVAGCFFRFM